MSMKELNTIANGLQDILSELRFQRNEDQTLWDAEDIGIYLKLKKSSVQSRVISQPDFPRSIRTPSESGKGGRRWIAKEVKQWVLRHRDPVAIPRGRAR